MAARNRGYIMMVLVLVMAVAQACSKSPTIEEASGLGLPTELEVIKVVNDAGDIVTEHRDPGEITAIVAGLNDAERSYVDDPEPSGKRYKLELVGKSKSLTLTLNDLSRTNGTAPSAKVYETGTGENEQRAWALPTAWVPHVMHAGSSDKDAPVMSVTIDEHSDSVVLIANRDMDRSSVEHAIQTSLHNENWGTLPDYRYAVEWTDDRRAVVRFTELQAESAIGFMLDGSMTMDGKPLEISLPDDGRVVVVRAGLPWSGIRTINTQGVVIREHAFNDVRLIQTPGDKTGERFIQIYYQDGVVLLEPDQGEVSRIDRKEWPDAALQRAADSGIGVLYAVAETGDYYIAQGLEHVYRYNGADDRLRLLFRADEAIYGLASSPDGRHVAVLTDAENNLGPYADLTIYDAEGNVTNRYKKASYIGHSEGWHLIYPVAWLDNETVAVSLLARPDLDFERGQAIYRLGKGLVEEKARWSMPDDAYVLLKSEIPDWSGEKHEIIRALPRPNDDNGRFIAVQVAGYGTFRIDRQAGIAARIGAGDLIGWSPSGNMLVWYSTEGISPEIAIMD